MLSGDLPSLFVSLECSLPQLTLSGKSLICLSCLFSQNSFREFSQNTVSISLAISSHGTSDLCLPSQGTHLLLMLSGEVLFLPVFSDYFLNLPSQETQELML